ncbi:hypothetical protein [Algoriphagus sediminis]|uniref:Uncharacterized protein n=1 Tax=Algoriphagus sediminis TaxID=3057113 RepID=A0ABT7YFL8_9BACT|nr:hypothetical protein [Algoriphagus sediminis]MDN3205271.1 hypothetical protein [Algoriphagus sediminis]
MKTFKSSDMPTGIKSEISSYNVAFTRSKINGALTTFETESIEIPYRTQLVLHLNEVSVGGQQVEKVDIKFIDNRDFSKDEAFSRNLGWRNGSTIILFLAIMDFENLYKILNTEKQIFFYWREQKITGYPMKISSFKISSSPNEIDKDN